MRSFNIENLYSEIERCSYKVESKHLEIEMLSDKVESKYPKIEMPSDNVERRYFGLKTAPFYSVRGHMDIDMPPYSNIYCLFN